MVRADFEYIFTHYNFKVLCQHWIVFLMIHKEYSVFRNGFLGNKKISCHLKNTELSMFYVVWKINIK